VYGDKTSLSSYETLPHLSLELPYHVRKFADVTAFNAHKTPIKPHWDCP
jgi:hypothetical protein